MRTRRARREEAAQDVLSLLLQAAFIDIRSTNVASVSAFPIPGLDDRDRIGLLADMFQRARSDERRGPVARRLPVRARSTVDRDGERNRGAAHAWLDGVAEVHGLNRATPTFAAWIDPATP